MGQVKDDGQTFNYIVPPQIENLGKEAVKEYEDQMLIMQQWYNGWVDRLGNAGESTFEDARFVLPNGAETKMIVTMNARITSYNVCYTKLLRVLSSIRYCLVLM